MELKIEKTILENGIKKILPFVSKDMTNVSSCIEIEVKENELFMYATDYEISIKIVTNNIFDFVDGKCLVNAQLLNKNISKLKNGEVHIKLVNDDLIINQKRTKLTIKTTSDDIFKSGITMSNMNKVDIDNSSLLESLKAVSYTIDPSNPKMELGGVLIKGYDNKIDIVSTNTRSLTIYSKESNSDINVILPKKLISELQKNITNDSEIYYSDTDIIISNENLEIQSRLINGKFPDYTRVIPTESKYNLMLNSERLKESINTVIGMSENINLKFQKESIEISSTEDKNKAITYIEGLDLDIDSSIDITINSKYLLDFLKNCSNDFNFKINSSKLPILCESGFIKCIIMPLITD